MSGEANKTYTAAYKCRLCGESFISCITGNRAKAAGIVAAISAGVTINEPLAPTMYNIHYCKDGGMGIADFQGWKMKNRKDGES